MKKSYPENKRRAKCCVNLKGRDASYIILLCKTYSGTKNSETFT